MGIIKINVNIQQSRYALRWLLDSLTYFRPTHTWACIYQEQAGKMSWGW